MTTNQDATAAEAAQPIAMVDEHGTVQHVNADFLRAWDYSQPADVLGLPAGALWRVPLELNAGLPEPPAGLEGGWAYSSDGTAFPVHASTTVDRDADGKPHRSVWCFHLVPPPSA